jgi:hypothetical protein
MYVELSRGIQIIKNGSVEMFKFSFKMTNMIPVWIAPVKSSDI